MPMNADDFDRVACGLRRALSRIDPRVEGTAVVWLTAVRAVRFELENTYPRFRPDLFERDCGVERFAAERARILRPLKSNHECRVCRRWLEGEWNTEHGGQRRPEVLAGLQAQMDNGRCDTCSAAEALARIERLLPPDM